MSEAFINIIKINFMAKDIIHLISSPPQPQRGYIFSTTLKIKKQ